MVKNLSTATWIKLIFIYILYIVKKYFFPIIFHCSPLPCPSSFFCFSFSLGLAALLVPVAEAVLEDVQLQRSVVFEWILLWRHCVDGKDFAQT